MRIGIFWYYKGELLGKAVPLTDADESLPGLLDSPDTHVVEWGRSIKIDARFPELKYMEYDVIPRGRILYDRVVDRPIVYRDAVLVGDVFKAKIRRYFDLEGRGVSWKFDNHYTTDTEILRGLMDS